MLSAGRPPTEPEVFTKTSFSSPPSSILSLPPSSSPTPSSGDSTDSSTTSHRAKRRIIQLSGPHKYSPYRTGKPNISEALELRFTARSLRGGAGSNITRHDVSEGSNLFARGIRRLSDAALQHATLLKHANRETRRHRAMASAWELKEVEHYSKLLEIIHHDDRKEYESSLKDESIVDPEDMDNWDDDDEGSLMRFNHEVYNEEVLAFSTSDAQLTQLEEEVQARVRNPVVKGDDVSFNVNQNKEN